MIWSLLSGVDTVQLYLLASEAEEAAAAFVRGCQEHPTATVETWRDELEALNIEMAANADAIYLCCITRHERAGNGFTSTQIW